MTLHQLAVKLFQLNLNLHDSATTWGLDVDAVVKWQPEPHDFFPSVEPWPTLFAHRYFTAHEQYPDGVADIVGYWAEDRILGGVAIFDRSQSWCGDSEPDVYFHSCRMEATWRIWQLLPDQQEALVQFLMQESRASNDLGPATNGPLPVIPSRANTVRIDPIDAIPVHRVYRDVWEREEPPELLRMQHFMTACVQRPGDYPEMEDVGDEIRRVNALDKANNP